MTVQACSACGAPLDLATYQPVLRCHFCGADNARSAAAASPFAATHAVPPHRPPPPRQAQRLPAYLAVGIGIFTVCIAIPLVIAVRSGAPMRAATTAVPVPTVPKSPAPTSTKPAAVPLANLHGTPIRSMGAGVEVDAPGRIGPPTAFDPIANWDWAQSIANAWWPDAKSYGLSADAFGMDGLVDLTDAHARVTYTFLSKSCRAAAAKEAETSTTSHDTSCTLEIGVKAGNPVLEISSIAVDFNAAEARRPVPKPPCTLAQAMTTVKKRLTPRPRYSARLVWNTWGMAYRISNGHDTASMDDVEISPSFCKPK